MNDLEIGDIVVITGTEYFPEYLGSLGKVVRPCGWHTTNVVPGVPIYWGYGVEFPCGDVSIYPPHFLEKAKSQTD